LNYNRPDYSPDGRYIAVGIYSYTTEEYDVYRLESGGQNKINLTSTPIDTEDLQPAWSPDGSQIAWRRDWRIWVMNEYGDSKTPITPTDLTARDPVWSPDGQWISFVAWDGDHEDVFIIQATGGTPINVTNHPEVDLGQSWSADSQKMVFESFRDNNWEIYSADISDPQNIQLTRLTNNPSNDHAPVYSNNGQRIAFLSDRNSGEFDFSIWTMQPEGSGQARLSSVIDVGRPLDWSPDDMWLVATVGFGSQGQVYKFNAQTGVSTRLSLTGFLVSNPIWRPDTWGE
jgi:acylaminoacyl-peptidase